MKLATATLIFAVTAVAGKSSSKREDCKDGEVWSPRFGQLLERGEAQEVQRQRSILLGPP